MERTIEAYSAIDVQRILYKHESLNGEMFYVESEPGDATRYSYIIYRDGPDQFTITPTRSTFIFPQRLDFWDIFTTQDEVVNQARVIELAEQWNCNPCTVLECMGAILQIKRVYG